MRIIVLAKQVPETGKARMDEETGTIRRQGVESILNPLDLYAVETALQLVEEHGGEVIVLSMGPRSAEKAVREAIAMGCTRGLLLSDRAFAGSDTWATSYALAQAVRTVGEFDLVLCGERATDGDTGQVGPEIAAFLDLPPVTYVSAIEAVEAGRIRVRRLIENGYERVAAQLPCVLTVVKEVADPRLPTLRGKRRARTAEIPVLGPAEIDADTDRLGLGGSPTRVVKITRPKVTREGERIHATREDEIEAAVDRIVEFLREHVPGDLGSAPAKESSDG